MPKRKTNNVNTAPPPVVNGAARRYVMPKHFSDCWKRPLSQEPDLAAILKCGCVMCAPRNWCVECMAAGRSSHATAESVADAKLTPVCKHCDAVERGTATMMSLAEIIKEYDPEKAVLLYGQRREPPPPVIAQNARWDMTHYDALCRAGWTPPGMFPAFHQTMECKGLVEPCAATTDVEPSTPETQKRTKPALSLTARAVARAKKGNKKP